MIQQMIYKGTVQGYQTVAASDGLKNAALQHRLEMLCRAPSRTWMQLNVPCPIFSRCALEDGIAVGLIVKDLHDRRGRSLSNILYVPREDVPDFAARMVGPEMFCSEFLDGRGSALPELSVQEDLVTPRLDVFPEAARDLFGNSTELLADFLAVVQLCCDSPEQRDFYGACVCLPAMEARHSQSAYLLMELLLRTYRRPGMRNVGYRTLWNGTENNVQYPIFFTSPFYMADVSTLRSMRYVLLDVARGEVFCPQRVSLAPSEADRALADALLNGDEAQLTQAIQNARSYEREQARLAELRRREEAERKRREAEEAERRRKEAEEAERRRKEAEEAERRRREAEEAERRRKEAEEAERRRKEAEEAERERREAEEAERRRKEAEEAERKRREAEEAERRRKEAVEEERKRREAEEAERKRREAEEAEHKRREAEEAERKHREAEEVERRRKEAKEAEHKRREAEEAERKRKEAEEAERRRKDEAAVAAVMSSVEARQNQVVGSMEPEYQDVYARGNRTTPGRGTVQRAGGYGSAWSNIEHAIRSNMVPEVLKELPRNLRSIEKRSGIMELLCMTSGLLDRTVDAVIYMKPRDYRFEEGYFRVAACILGNARWILFSKDRFAGGEFEYREEEALDLAERCMDDALLLCGCLDFPYKIDSYVKKRLQDYDVRGRKEPSMAVYRDFALWRLLYSVFHGLACDYKDLNGCRKTVEILRDGCGKAAYADVRRELADQAIWHMEHYTRKSSGDFRSAVTACYCASILADGRLALPKQISAYFDENPKARTEVKSALKNIWDSLGG